MSTKSIRLFSVKGVEFHDLDCFEAFKNGDFLFYSWGDEFDFSVNMQFLDLKNKLGQGGFGSVYLAYDSLNNREVAVKIMTLDPQGRHT